MRARYPWRCMGGGGREGDVALASAGGNENPDGQQQWKWRERNRGPSPWGQSCNSVRFRYDTATRCPSQTGRCKPMACDLQGEAIWTRQN